MRRAVFLDRDGVINHDPPEMEKKPKEWNDFKFFEGSLEAIVKLSQKIPVFVVSNQAKIAKGFLSYDKAELLNRKLKEVVEAAGGKITANYFSYNLSILQINT